MAKITLNDITTGYSGPSRINANFDLIEAAIENTLSRDGTSPNQMEDDFDMNGFRILNVGSPQSPLDVARLIDITGLITLTGMPIPAVLGNEGKLLFTDGVNLYWGDIQPEALPLFNEDDRGAVPETGEVGDDYLIWSDGGWDTLASRFVMTTNAPQTMTRALRSAFNTLSDAGTVTINTQLSNQFKLTLGGNRTLAFSNGVDGTNFVLALIQDGTGSRTVTWPTITWVPGVAPTLKTAPGDINIITIRYDGTTWYGNYDLSATDEGSGGTVSEIQTGEDNLDLFRRLGSPIVAATHTITIGDGVVISSRSPAIEALDLSGAFPSGTVINITNLGYIIGKGGEGGSASCLTAETGVVWALSQGNGEAGGNAIRGPATGVTVNINNASGRVWGGGGGGGSGGASADNAIASGGAGGGGAGCGRGGRGAFMKASGDVGVTSVNPGGDGILGLDGSDAGGLGTAGDGSTANGNGGAGGDGGDYGAAGTNGTAASDESNLIIDPGTGGAAGRAVTAGYAGTLNFTSGGSSPNVKGSV